MISEEGFSEALAFIARRSGSPAPTAAQARVMHAEALMLVRQPEDAPAALFFALARRPKLLRGFWAQACRLFALNQATALGRVLVASPDDLNQLRLDVATQAIGYAEVLAWFRDRLH